MEKRVRLENANVGRQMTGSRAIYVKRKGANKGL